MQPPTFKLNTGASIPAVGLGTWQSKSTELEHVTPSSSKANFKAVTYAIDTVGYRLLDGYIPPSQNITKAHGDTGMKSALAMPSKIAKRRENKYSSLSIHPFAQLTID
jgi:hypothetical protein